MSVVNSEEALRKLEKSKQDSNLLLNDAAQIAHLRFDEVQQLFLQEDLAAKSKDAPDFRLQWLLKWLVKKLVEASPSPTQNRISKKSKPAAEFEAADVQSKTADLVVNPKTWALLSFLVQNISPQASQSILFERRFTQLLTTCGNIIHKHVQGNEATGFDGQSDHAVDNNNDDQPRKRRKLSPGIDEDNPKRHLNALVIQHLLPGYLHVTLSYAQIIARSAANSSDTAPTTSRLAMPAWAENIDEASKMLHSILQVAVDQLKFPNLEGDPLIITMWLQIWHDFAASVKTADKQTVNRHFCEQTLNLCLRLLQSIGMKPNDKRSADLKDAIERQIALHVILPIRAEFNDKFATPWKSSSDPVEWKIIEPLYQHVVNQLGSALNVETVLGVEYLSFQKSDFASDLFDISTRIIPRNDLRRRQWERPWLDAFYLALLHLAFPQHLYRLEIGKNLLLAPVNEDLPFDSQQPPVWPGTMLTVLLDRHSNASLSSILYLCSGVLRWRLDQVPTPILAQLVQTKIDAFIPQTNEPNPGCCLELLMGRLDVMEELTATDFSKLVKDVVRPIVRAFAQSRSMPDFMDLWLPRLQNAFRAKSTAQAQSTDPIFLWDDEDVFEEFEVVTKAHASARFAQDRVEIAIKGMKGIRERIGPTADIFANLAICNCILRAGNSVASLQNDQQKLTTLSKSVISALHQQSDYQGQRWRLWQILRTLLDSMSQHHDLTEIHELLDTRAASTKVSDSKNVESYLPAFLMECLHSFACQTRYGSTTGVEDASNHLKQLLVKLSEAYQEITNISDHFLFTTWNGRLATLKTLPQLACGYLGLLLQETQSRLAMFREHLQPALKQILMTIPGSLDWQRLQNSCLLHEVEMLLSMFCHLNNENPISHYMEIVLVGNHVAYHPRIHSLPIKDVEKRSIRRQAEKIVERLVNCAGGEIHMSRAEISQLFAVLARLVAVYPISVGLPEHFARLVVAAQVLDVEHPTEEEDATIHLKMSAHCLSNILRTSWERLQQGSSRDKQKSSAKEIFRWCKDSIKQLKKRLPTQSEALVQDVLLALMVETEPGVIDLADVRKYQGKFLSSILTMPQDSQLLHILTENGGFLAGCTRNADQKFEHLEAGVASRLSALIVLQNSTRQSENHALAELQEGTVLKTREVQNMLHDLQTEVQQSHNTPMSELLELTTSSGSLEIVPSTAFKLAVMIANTNNSDLTQTPAVVPLLSQYASLHHLKYRTTPQSLILQLELSKLVLTKHSEVVGQSTIDSLMQSLCLVSSAGLQIDKPQSQSGDETNRPSSDAIYDRLFTTVDILLSRYRRRLNGRSHLVLQLLQSLLRCLFYTPEQTYIYQNPASTKQKQAFRSSLPAWLDDGRSQPLSPTSAERLSRILSSICNPSTASARSAHRHKRKVDSMLELNDETQKAKRIASQYMQYLVMEYARCTLDGVIAPQTRDKLMPGLYSILDALGKDMMRTMNAAMDASSRAIFKGLYDDWTKYGKWDQT